MYKTKSTFNGFPREFSGVMETIWNNGLNNLFGDDHGYLSKTVPINIKENEAGFELQLAAPGLKKEDFKISLDKNILSVSFEQKEENKQETDKWVRQEFKARSFKKSFTLTDKINKEAINAKYEDGILYLNLPKTEPADSTKQEIPVN